MVNCPVTVGVLTHDRAELFSLFLTELKKEIVNYDEQCRLIVVNNSGSVSRSIVDNLIDASGIRGVIEVALFDSPENNISVGRNLLLKETKTKFLLLIDDDEQPELGWISSLVKGYRQYKTPFVAGPVVPVFPEEAPEWVKMLDLHNIGKRKTGDIIRRVGTGNCLIDMDSIQGVWFDESYGLVGGEDSKFFETLHNQGKFITWVSQARVQEIITPAKSTPQYVIRRFMKQGYTYRLYSLENSTVRQKIVFYCKALIYALVGVVMGITLMPFSSRLCAYWMKRGFTNLGKFTSFHEISYS